MNKIQIDFVSDVACPWCVIAYKRLDQAITELDLQDKVALEWHPFFINPDMPPDGENNNDYGTRKYQRSARQNEFNRERMTDLAKDAGFEFNLDNDSRIFNTRNAHIAIEYAKKFGKQTDLKIRLFEAFFTEQKNISNKDLLVNEMKVVGLDSEKLTDIFNNSEIQKRIDTKIKGWRALGINTVPTIIFNERSLLSGRQTVEGYKEMLASVISE